MGARPPPKTSGSARAPPVRRSRSGNRSPSGPASPVSWDATSDGGRGLLKNQTLLLVALCLAAPLGTPAVARAQCKSPSNGTRVDAALASPLAGSGVIPAADAVAGLLHGTAGKGAWWSRFEGHDRRKCDTAASESDLPVSGPAVVGASLPVGSFAGFLLIGAVAAYALERGHSAPSGVNATIGRLLPPEQPTNPPSGTPPTVGDTPGEGTATGGTPGGGTTTTGGTTDGGTSGGATTTDGGGSAGGANPSGGTAGSGTPTPTTPPSGTTTGAAPGGGASTNGGGSTSGAGSNDGVMPPNDATTGAPSTDVGSSAGPASPTASDASSGSDVNPSSGSGGGSVIDGDAPPLTPPGSVTNPVVTPEPATFALVAVGILALAVGVRRRRAA